VAVRLIFMVASQVRSSSDMDRNRLEKWHSMPCVRQNKESAPGQKVLFSQTVRSRQSGQAPEEVRQVSSFQSRQSTDVRLIQIRQFYLHLFLLKNSYFFKHGTAIFHQTFSSSESHTFLSVLTQTAIQKMMQIVSFAIRRQTEFNSL
jgi:hypothetical protein